MKAISGYTETARPHRILSQNDDGDSDEDGDEDAMSHEGMKCRHREHFYTQRKLLPKAEELRLMQISGRSSWPLPASFPPSSELVCQLCGNPEAEREEGREGG